MKTKHNIDLEEVGIFITEVTKTKKYDRERISEYHDRIFGKNDRPSPDAPCPIMQMRKIKAWYQDQKKK